MSRHAHILNAAFAWAVQAVFTPLVAAHGAMMFMIAAVNQGDYLTLLHPQGLGMVISLATWFVAPFLLLGILLSFTMLVVLRRTFGSLSWSPVGRVLIEGPYWLLLLDVALFAGLPLVGLQLG